MSTTRRALNIFFGCIALALAACGGKPPVPAPAPATSIATPTPSGPAVPADPKLAKLYEQTCKACHTNPASGAPQAGDAKAWAPRVAQGMPALLQHAIGGYKGMPPMGSCMDCSQQDFEALINFMAGTGAAK